MKLWRILLLSGCALAAASPTARTEEQPWVPIALDIAVQKPVYHPGEEMLVRLTFTNNTHQAIPLRFDPQWVFFRFQVKRNGDFIRASRSTDLKEPYFPPGMVEEVTVHPGRKHTRVLSLHRLMWEQPEPFVEPGTYEVVISYVGTMPWIKHLVTSNAISFSIQ